MNYMLALIDRSMNDSRDILSSKEDVPGAPHLNSHSVPGKPKDSLAKSAALDMVVSTAEQGLGTLDPTASATTTLPVTTTPTITTGSISSGVFTECALAMLSTRLGQQCEERAKDRCHNEELSQ